MSLCKTPWLLVRIKISENVDKRGDIIVWNRSFYIVIKLIFFHILLLIKMMMDFNKKAKKMRNCIVNIEEYKFMSSLSWHYVLLFSYKV